LVSRRGAELAEKTKVRRYFGSSLDFSSQRVINFSKQYVIPDRDFLRRFEECDSLCERDSTLAKQILDLFILKTDSKTLSEQGR
jgi:hypothetical protein